MWHLLDHVFTRNLLKGVYSPESDSISIPIIANQALIIAMGLFILPICMLGSKWMIQKLGDTRPIFRVIALIICAATYVIVGLMTLSLSATWLDRDHLEISLGYGLACIVIIGMFIKDTLHLYRKIYPAAIGNHID